MGTVVNRPFTVELDFKATGDQSTGTLFDIWYHYVGHFRLRIAPGGRLQVRQRLRWYNHPPDVELTSRPCGVTDGQWHRITVTMPNVADESCGLGIYLDGRLICSQTDAATHGSYKVSDA
jgi:hypothetical protein